MLLTVDVGNSTAAAALFRGGKIVHRGRVPTPAAWTARHLAALLPAGQAGRARAAIVSSVVPRLDRALADAIRRACSQRPVFLDHRTPTGIALRIDRPAQLGADRIADCAGALALFPPPLTVIDSGTATTFDLVDARGAYCGGCILPGVAIAIHSLAANTAKLKDIAFTVPRSPVGRNTADSIRAGIHFGMVGALQHLIALYRSELGLKAKVVATGGLIGQFRGQVIGIDAFEPDLIFLGLRRIHERLVGGNMTMGAAGADYDYIIRLIQYLDRRHNIRFFITSSDFDVLYRWWEKRIPEALVRECFDRVVERGRRSSRRPSRFAQFSHEVRRGYDAFLALRVGRACAEPVDDNAATQAFIDALPPALEGLRGDFAALFRKLRPGKAGTAETLEEKLLESFAEDTELNAKTAWFLNNLAPPLRRPEIARRYRLNYLMGKFGIPSLD